LPFAAGLAFAGTLCVVENDLKDMAQCLFVYWRQAICRS
jgi:hypothetical protein